MKLLDHPPTGAEPCPVCNTLDDRPGTLMPIDGTRDVAAAYAHLDCLELRYDECNGMIYSIIPRITYLEENT